MPQPLCLTGKAVPRGKFFDLGVRGSPHPPTTGGNLPGGDGGPGDPLFDHVLGKDRKRKGSKFSGTSWQIMGVSELSSLQRGGGEGDT